MHTNTHNTIQRAPGIGSQLADLLEERILHNVYPVGAKLPPERKLAEEFAVSRQSLRAALGILATRGLIQTRQGDGHYVSERLHTGLNFGWETLLHEKADLGGQLLDFRSGIESMLAALAAERRTPADLERMRFWLDRLAQAYADGDTDRQAQADVAFHQSIAEAAHNIMFTRLSDSLLRLMQSQTKQNLHDMYGVSNVYSELTKQHEAIYAEVAQGRPQQAAEAAKQHIAYVQSCLNECKTRAGRQALADTLAQADKERTSFQAA